MDAELLLEREALDLVAFAERAVFIDHDLRHDEAGDALGAFRRTGGASQNEVHDLFG